MIHRKTTQELLADSLQELAKSKAITKITVKEIAANCELSTATFYNHFKDKYELISWIYTSQMTKIFDKYATKEITWQATVKELIQLLNNDEIYYKNAFLNTSGQNSFYWSTHVDALEFLIEAIKKRNEQRKINKEIIFEIKFYLKGLSATVFDWYLCDKDYSVEELTTFLCEVAPEHLKSYLN